MAEILKPFVNCNLAETLSSTVTCCRQIKTQKWRCYKCNKLVVETLIEKVWDVAQELMRYTQKSNEDTVVCILFNCSQPGAICNALDDWALAESSKPQAMRTDLAVERYVICVAMGVEAVGGCCGFGPKYIAAIHQMLQERGLH
ncbi:unnamed protein product [Peronospora destructor]|uniref:Hcy-binding domain-containing protein n=1 Tax=Peronospora destructor TaxID=86335 RepID=A0AAV0SWV1_9STRA|nr:unnamed protein product [Peronospora destructor]